MLRDSRAKALVVSSAIFDKFKDAIEKSPYLKYVVVSGAPIEGFQSLRSVMDRESEDFETVVLSVMSRVFGCTHLDRLEPLREQFMYIQA